LLGKEITSTPKGKSKVSTERTVLLEPIYPT
jgi:hypothetical protein